MAISKHNGALLTVMLTSYLFQDKSKRKEREQEDEGEEVLVSLLELSFNGLGSLTVPFRLQSMGRARAKQEWSQRKKTRMRRMT